MNTVSKRKARLSALTAAAVLFTLIASSFAMTLGASASWDGVSAAVGFSGGDGSENNPFLISSENELAKLAKDVNEGESYAGQYFAMKGSLDLGGKAWTPIGNASDKPFSGNFDGGEAEITGLVVNGGGYGGLFGITKDATISNLTITGAKVTSNKFCGVLIAQQTCTEDKTTMSGIYNCHVESCEVIGTSAGGLVGRASKSGAGMQMTIAGCSVSNTTVGVPDDSLTEITEKNSFMGGVLGVGGCTTLDGCSATGVTVTAGGARATAYGLAGGIVGCQGADNQALHIRNCYAYDVKLTVKETSTSANPYAGGLIAKAGHTDTGCEIVNCFAAKITTENKIADANAGTLIGQLKNFVNYFNCYSDGETAVGVDAILIDPPVVKVSAADLAAGDAVETMKLNEGNSAAVWKNSPADGHPVIDFAAVKGNTVNVTFYDPFAEVTTEEVTTAGGEVSSDNEVTTAAPGDGTTAAPEVSSDAPEVTTAAPKTEEGGCSSSLSVAALSVIAALSLCFVRRRD